MELRKRIRKNAPEKKEKSGLEAPKKLKILITIVDRTKTDFYLDILEGYEVNMQTVIYGHGTAPSDIASVLGITQSDKVVIVSVIQEEKIKEIMIAYEDKYFKTKNGKGIAFTIPITSVIGVSIYQFLSNSMEKRGE